MHQNGVCTNLTFMSSEWRVHIAFELALRRQLPFRDDVAVTAWKNCLSFMCCCYIIRLLPITQRLSTQTDRCYKLFIIPDQLKIKI